MGKQIVIYDANSSKKSGSFIISKGPRRFRITYFLGSLFLTISFIGIAFFFLPIINSELQYRLHFLRQPKNQPAENQIRSKFSLIISPDENQFELIIPKVGIKTQVLTNVNPAIEQEYDELLSDSAAHAMGSSLPGEGGLVYIFGHSTNSPLNIRYFNPVFYLLKELNSGDEIGIIHKGKLFMYQVAEKTVVKADDLSLIKPDENREKLVLQTCWPPGTTWERLLVIAYPEIKT